MARPRLASLARFAGAGAFAVALAACSTQRWPAPMQPATLPLPPGEGAGILPGIEEVEVIRHADPVQLRRAGANAAFPMRFWDKKERARAGAWVLTDSGGRAELLWPRDGTSLVLFERGAARIGERDRDEPAVHLRGVTRAKLQLGPLVRVELEGGAILSGSPDELSGPFVLERLPVGDVLRLFNKAKHTARVEFRDEVLAVGPGQAVDLPVLADGSGPIEISSAVRGLDGASIRLTAEGPVELVDGVPGVTVAAAGKSRVRGQGVEVQLGPGGRARFTDLAQRADSPLGSPPSTEPVEAATEAIPPVPEELEPELPNPDEPNPDEPTADEPTADEPTADEPTADEPTAPAAPSAPEDPALDAPAGPPAGTVPDQPTEPPSTADEPTGGPLDRP